MRTDPRVALDQLLRAIDPIIGERGVRPPDNDAWGELNRAIVVAREAAAAPQAECEAIERLREMVRKLRTEHRGEEWDAEGIADMIEERL